eukprot:4039191-Pyramimonas_sp.AAC.1
MPLRQPDAPDDADRDRRCAIDELETITEILQHWASDWLPSLYLDPHRDDEADWHAWCEEYVLRMLRRDSFQ